MSDSQDIETATTAIQTSQVAQPDSKTRRYDRQLRLWAATGQSSLESARILVCSGSATSTSVLKNLVLPGVGHFTILDAHVVTPEDAGNNFFLEGLDSVGKSRAEEAVRLLSELNDGVEGQANTANLDDILEKDPSYITSFSLVIAHNLPSSTLDRLATLLWSNTSFPPLIVIRSAGFLAEIFIQFHEHPIIDSHPETPASLRIDKPFPALLDHALKLDIENMDVIDHGNIPYVVILVRALEEWKASHNGSPPKTYEEKSEFKKGLLARKKKADEENFDEAAAQAYRVWTETTVPNEISKLFSDPGVTSLTPSSPAFFHLLKALQQFSSQPPHTLPLSSTLPDMKSDTASYVHLQKLYKARAEEEKLVFKSILKKNGAPVDDAIVDEFVKNAHGLKLLRGEKWGSLDADKNALSACLKGNTKETATHLALSALARIQAANPSVQPTEDDLRTAVLALIGGELPRSSSGEVIGESELEEAIGELARAPTADLPNTAAFLGGLVAQEAIKMITRQYVPVKGVCVVDLIGSWTGVVQP
ncbi:hypothetical protein BD410DRAFT_772863 [Rickenella mellea]|uniref:NEDD8-activating enzyme E1 regulatory subunit n=1 Tax=Rickenella mellea TaxID=50990 RepID=A0A4Y7PZ02_9AGAM|nr:hypothetical protein BD410DRAFT_772863 [Rickenella mellea]